MIKKYVDDFLAHLQYEKGYSALTIESYRNDLSGFLEFLSGHEIRDAGDITYRTLHLYISELGSMSLKPSTIERKTAALKSFFKYLTRKGVILKNPAALISSPRHDRRLPVVLESSEIAGLISYIPESDALSIRNKAIVTLLYASGLRVSELCSLDLKDIDYREGILIVTGKGSKQRIVPTGETAVKMILKYLNSRKELQSGPVSGNALFLTRSGKRIQDRMVRYIITRYIDELAIQKHVSPHTLRHTFATALLENGAGIRVIQEMLGHESLSTTQVYTHLTIEKLRESYDKFHPHA